MITPCMHCAARHVGCHSNCDAYAQYKESYRKIAAAARAYTSHEADSVLINTSIRVNKKFHRVKGR